MKKILFLLLTFVISLDSKLYARAEQIELNLLDGNKIKLWINIYKAEKTPAPTIIVMHGCGGVSSDHHTWAQIIQSWGFNSVVLDSFSGVISGDVCRKPSLSHAGSRGVQAYSLASWVENQEWSQKKIGAIGFSHGGNSMLAMSTKELRNNFPGNKIISTVAFYPFCEPFFQIAQTRQIPLQIHIGELDNWTPANPCKDTANLWKLGENLFIYKDSHHHFDRVNANWTNGTWISKSNPEARELSIKRTKEFFEKTLK